MKKKPKPNKVLPKGAFLIKPVRLVLGDWSPLVFDAKVVRAGITWYRVKGGLSEGDNSREDWLADVPKICISVHDYHWNGDTFGPQHGSFDKAVKAESKAALRNSKERLAEKQELVLELKNSIAVLEKSCAK